MKPEHIKLLADKDWRLNNLYWITDKEGKPTRFRMTPEQREYFEGIHTRNIILKARQLGFTTEVCIIQLDAALFESAKCALIAHTLNDAKRLFREKVKYAYDKLPAEIKAANPASNDSSGELVFKKGGSLYVSTSFRGGTLRYLHVSEFGKICAKYPDKAREIVTGAFEAVSTASLLSRAQLRAGRVTSSITARRQRKRCCRGSPYPRWTGSFSSSHGGRTRSTQSTRSSLYRCACLNTSQRWKRSTA